MQAREEGKPLPGGSLLVRNFRESQFLAAFLFASGMLVLFMGFTPLFAVREITPVILIVMVAAFVLGGILMFAAQAMMRRFDVRIRNWRNRKR